jgi:hypothetical protein
MYNDTDSPMEGIRDVTKIEGKKWSNVAKDNWTDRETETERRRMQASQGNSFPRSQRTATIAFEFLQLSLLKQSKKISEPDSSK